MKVLITGNLGYIGSVLSEYLNRNINNINITGLDIGFFKDQILGSENKLSNQIIKDIRNISQHDIRGYDVVIHLAAMSNDPLGEFDTQITDEINYKSTIRIAKYCKENGVKKFIFLSTQSIYGISKSEDELDEYSSLKKPITVYAITKWKAEQEIMSLNSNDFGVVIFRPSTVFGSSPRLRCDIVFNNFLASAYLTNKIVIKSDGTPWRPVIHVLDVCQAIKAGIVESDNKVNGKVFNIGISNGNFTVNHIAEVAKSLVDGSEIIYKNEPVKDSRTYKVSFKRINDELKDNFKPQWDLLSGGKELISFFKEVKFRSEDFYGIKTNRLKALKKIDKNIINNGK